MQKITLLTLVLCIGAFFLFKADRYENSIVKVDREGVKAAVLDYVEGLYAVDTARIYRSVHPDLRKRGYYFSQHDEAYKGPTDMTFQQLVSLSAKWNKDGSNATATSPKEITVFDVLDKTASAKLVAEWGVDYFHLVKLKDKWYIMNVLWQSPPIPNE